MERVLAAVEAEAAKVAEHPVGVDSVEEAPEREVAVGGKVLVVVALAVVVAGTTVQAATMDQAEAVEETMALAAVAVLVDLAVSVAVDWAKVAVLEGNLLKPVRGLPRTLKPLESMQLSRVSSKSTEYWN